MLDRVDTIQGRCYLVFMVFGSLFVAFTGCSSQEKSSVISSQTFTVRKDGGPIRIPPEVAIQKAVPQRIVAGKKTDFQMSFIFSKDVTYGTLLKLQLYGGRNNMNTFTQSFGTDPSADGYLWVTTGSGYPLALSPVAEQPGTFLLDVPMEGLPAGTVVNVTASRASIWPHRALDKFLIVYTDGGDEPESVNWDRENQHKIIAAATLDIIGDVSADHFHAYAPSEAGSGVPFSILVRPEDRYHNLTSTTYGKFAIYDNGEAVSAQTATIDDTTAVHLNNIVLSVEGVHRLNVVELTTGKTATTNPVVCRANAGTYKPYWGMLHGHTEMSDGFGSVDHYYKQIRDEAALDFAAVSDHGHPLETTDEMWNIIADKAKYWNEPGKFVTFLGYEWATWRYNGDGDRNVYYLDDNHPMYRSADGYFPRPWDLFRALANETAIIIPHHPATDNFCDWTRHDPLKERLVEIYQIRGGFECSPDIGYPAPPHTNYSPVPKGYICNALQLGWRVGFTAGSDDHSGSAGLDVVQGGLTMVFATGLTRQEIWDGLWNRRVVATTGPRTSFYYELDGHPLGSELLTSVYPGLMQQRKIHIEFHGMAPIDKIDIIRNNTIAYSISVSGNDYIGDWLDTTGLGSLLLNPTEFTPTPFLFYYVRVRQVDGEIAWASPVWILDK